MTWDLKLRVVLQKPTPGVDFGLQKGAGAIYETIQIQRTNGNDLHFDFSVKVNGNQQKDPQPKLTGPFVQGTAPGKFIYIDIGTYAGQKDSIWSRRLKIPLAGITWEMASLGNADPDFFLETLVPGTGSDSSPNCATVKPFSGWKAARSRH